MSKFADSPYFLLNDFMHELVEPVRPEYLQPDIVNMWNKVVFTDILYNGSINLETSTQLYDVASKYTSATQAQIFTSHEVVWNGWLDQSPSSMYVLESTDSLGDLSSTGVLLRGGDMYGQIVVDGGDYVDMYAKKDEYGFVPIRVTPVYEEPREKKYFRFDIVNVSELNYDGTTITYDSDVAEDEPYFDSEYVSIQTYDYTYDTSPVRWSANEELTISDILEPDTETYFRKDSSFHGWLIEFANNYYQTKYGQNFDIRNFVNTDKMFLYFGKIFPTDKALESDPDRYHIVFNGMKDWVQAALPPNNRKENLVEFLDTYFDQIYSEGYQLLKDVWSLRDGRECNKKYLGYVPTFYGVKKVDDIPDWFSDSFREYATELVWLMKRKGTYASMYIIYELLCGNSRNIFNVLERWHTDTTGIVNTSPQDYEYQDHIYTSLYGKPNPTGLIGVGPFRYPEGLIGAGPFWYSKQDSTNYPEGYLEGDDKVLSPYYRVDLDLSVEPVTQLEILPKQISESLYYNWDLMRPINRQSEYNLVYAPYTDITGREYSLYEHPYTNQSITKALDNVKFDSNNYLHIQTEPIDTLTIKHDLFTSNVIVTAYTTSLTRQVPTKIQIIDDERILVEWPEPVSGVVIVSKASQPMSTYDPVSWRIRHGLNRKEMIFQVRTQDGIVYQPENAYTFDRNTLYIEGAFEDDSEVFVKQALTLGDTYDSDGDDVDDSTITQDIWIFDSVDIDESKSPKEVTKYTYEGVEWYAWVIDHPYNANMFQVNCYDSNNQYMEPANILNNELDDGGYPELVILWDKVDDTNDPNNYLGFAAIDNVGDIVSFYGVIPRDLDGNMLPVVQWRLTIETDEEIYTFLTDGSNDSSKLFSGKSQTINYFDYSDTDNKTYVYGDVGLMEQDDDWYYYTFTVTDEALSQLGIRDYKVIGIELVNKLIRRSGKQRIVYSRLSGIYKPLGVNFVGHFRIWKDPLGFNRILLDHLYVPLLDYNEGELLY